MALLNLDQATVSRLGLEPIKKKNEAGYLFDGIIPARIAEVTVGTQKHEKGEFAGKDIPTLEIEFTNFKLDASDPDRFMTYSFKPVGSKTKVEGTEDTYEDRDPVEVIKNMTEQWSLLKHFLESLFTSPNYRDITKISKLDYTTYFDLPQNGNAEDRITAYKAFFEYIAKFVNGDGNETKSQIVDATGLALPIWIKALPNYSNDPKRSKKYYEISRFIGQGVFEPMKLDKGFPISPKIIKIKASESLELTSVNTSKIPGANPGNSASNQNIDKDVMDLLTK